MGVGLIVVCAAADQDAVIGVAVGRRGEIAAHGHRPRSLPATERFATSLVNRRLGVLISGRGSNLQSIIDAIGDRRARRRDCRRGLEPVGRAGLVARARGRHRGAVSGSSRVSGSDDVRRGHRRAAQARDVGLVCLAGFMRLVGEPLLRGVPEAILNIHPSLLPAFPGARCAGQALDHGVKVSWRDRASRDRGARRGTDRAAGRRAGAGRRHARFAGGAHPDRRAQLYPEAIRPCSTGAGGSRAGGWSVSRTPAVKRVAAARSQREDDDFRRAVHADRHVDRPHAAADEHGRADPAAPSPATTGNFRAAIAPTAGRTTWPPCVWPDSTSGTLSAAASAGGVDRGPAGSPDRHVLDERGMSLCRRVQNRIPASSIALSPIVRRVRASVRTCICCLARAAGMSWSSSWLPRIPNTPFGADRPLSASADGADELTVAPRDVVAAEHDQVGPRAHRQGHGASDIVRAHPAASVHIGDESDAQAREFRRQSVHRNVHVRQLERFASVQESVRSDTSDRADARRGDRLQRRAAGDGHRRYSKRSAVRRSTFDARRMCRRIGAPGWRTYSMN